MTHLQPPQLTSAIKQEAARLGFDFCCIAPAAPAPHTDFLLAWLAQGRAGEMSYLERYVVQRGDPRNLAEGGATFHSLIVLGVDYHQVALPPELRDDPSRGIIASYAWGDDYHEIIRPELHALDSFIRSRTGRTQHGKCLVDTGPVLERDWAHTSGLGFTGKNCCTIHPQAGSWLFLAVVLVPETLAYDTIIPAIVQPEPSSAAVLTGLPPSGDYGHWRLSDAHGPGSVEALATCGRCTRCLSACPTAAFVGPYHLDPLRCIAYWTIEARAPVPNHLRAAFANRIFGCDICQEICPWNRGLPDRSPRLPGLAARPERMAVPLVEGFAPDNPYWLDENAFRAHFRRSPILRARRNGMLRNVCIALGNWADPAALPALQQALADPDPLPRGHAAWALGQLWTRQRHAAAADLLAATLTSETDEWVRGELAAALDVDSTRNQPSANSTHR